MYDYYDEKMYNKNKDHSKSKSDFISNNCRGVIHVIQPGDTLYRLAQKYHVSVSAIMCENPFINIYNLQIGDELCIPVSCRKCALKD